MGIDVNLFFSIDKKKKAMYNKTGDDENGKKRDY